MRKRGKMSNDIIEKVLAYCEEQRQVLKDANQVIKSDMMNRNNTVEESIDNRSNIMQNFGYIMAYTDIQKLILREQIKESKEYRANIEAINKELQNLIDNEKKKI